MYFINFVSLLGVHSLTCVLIKARTETAGLICQMLIACKLFFQINLPQMNYILQVIDVMVEVPGS